jgi:DNA-binding LacI/PurR family transcriptional regulator
MGVTIKEVAALAGVSAATVSRVLHNNSRISEQTQIKVRAAMEKLGYIPNIAARSLAGKSPRTLGIVLPNNSDELFKNPFFINAMRGISVYAQEHGYFLLYSFSRDEEEEVQFLEKYVHSGWVAGIVLLTTRENDRCVSFLEQARFPFSMIGRPENLGDTLWVDNDNFHAMYQVVNHLLDKGHRRIGFVGGPPSFRVTKDRLLGYRQALSGRGIDIEEDLIFQGHDFSEEEGIRGGRELLGRGRVEAFATTDDQLAFGVMEVCRDQGLDHLAVTGFNNTPRGLYQTPTLTTVDVQADLLGRRAAELIIDSLESDDPRRDHYIVETKLIERQSSHNRV